MVDCRPVAGAPPASATTPPAPGAPLAALADQPPSHLAAQGPGGDAGATMPPPGPPPASVRASTPAAPAPVAAPAPPLNSYAGMGGGYGPAPYMYGGGAVKGGGVGGGGMVLCAPPPPLPPVPPHINTAVHKSMQANGSDLPMNDIPTLRYFFNLGVDVLWGGLYAPPPPPLHLPPAHPAPPAPPRYYSPAADLAQEMQQGLSLHDRPPPASHNGEHKAPSKAGAPGADKQLQKQGPAQRPPLGPRFNRGNGEGNHNHGGHQNNKNNYNNKGRMNNSRRNSHTEAGRGGGGGGGAGAGGYGPEECGGVEPAVYTLPYVQYPPPIYHYYPLESDPGMMSMMGGVGYMGYMGEEMAEHYPPAPMLPPYYPPYQPHHAPPPHQHEHK